MRKAVNRKTASDIDLKISITTEIKTKIVIKRKIESIRETKRIIKRHGKRKIEGEGKKIEIRT